MKTPKTTKIRVLEDDVEKAWEKAMKKRLEPLGWLFFRNAQGGRTFKAGLGTGSADWVGLDPHGRFAAVELKSPTGTQSDEQIAWGDKVWKRLGIYQIVNDVNVDVYVDALIRKSEALAAGQGVTW